MAVTSYPGTVTPLRGLGAFSEAERDVFWGREAETGELARLVTGDGYRAGLLHGEPGVGKTSLLCAGLIPHLQDHGVVALLCEDNTQPAASLARAFTRATNKAPRDGESPVVFLARTVAEALRGQQYLFILDDIDAALATRDETVIGELADVFARVVTRSGGRARFLFCSESSELHRFGNLERRTGSLFPPSSRLELEAFSADQAAVVLDRMGSISGLTSDTQLTRFIAEGLNHGGPVTAAELQIAALAMRDLGANNGAAIDAIGGPSELGNAWLVHAAKQTGDERAALRLLAQLAQGKGKANLDADWITDRANLPAAFTTTALNALSEHGVVTMSHRTDDSEKPRYRLAHQVLAPTVRALAAPAQAAAQRAFELLGSKSQTRGRLTMREWYEVKRQRIEPANPNERAVIDRTKRFATIALGLAVAIPIVLLIIIYISNSGRYYFDVTGQTGAERVVVRDGRPGLSMFHWLGFGDVVADTGFDRKMVADGAWGDLTSEDITFDGGELAEKSLSIVEPKRAALINYAIDGGESALDTLLEDHRGPAERPLPDTLALGRRPATACRSPIGAITPPTRPIRLGSTSRSLRCPAATWSATRLDDDVEGRGLAIGSGAESPRGGRHRRPRSGRRRRHPHADRAERETTVHRPHSTETHGASRSATAPPRTSAILQSRAYPLWDSVVPAVGQLGGIRRVSSRRWPRSPGSP